MGFYNGLANKKKSFLQFDHVYPSRVAMEEALTTDEGPSEVAVGGYALVQYWNENRNLIPAFQFDAASPYLSADQNGEHLFLVAIEDVESTSTSEETSTNENETEFQETEDTETNPTTKDNEELAEDKKAYIINKNSYFVVTNGAGEEVGYFSCVQSGYTEDDLYTTGYYKAKFKIESATADREGTEKDNYIWNYKVDRKQYPGAGRGWNGTVWQKIISAEGAKYQFIADLNSATPTFDVTYEAPTETPLVPHFDADISNIYYKIHMQPQWGVRVREAIPEKDGKGEPKYTTEDKVYPSDVSGEFVKSTWKENGEVQQESANSIPLAIYYNKEGFNKNKSSSKSEELDDFIKFTPTGISGNLYYNNDSVTAPFPAVDTYELSIMLPSIGQTISDVWDIVYGGNVNKDDEGNPIDNSRNTGIEWDDYTGARALPTSRSEWYGYNDKALNTIAGSVNTFHDIIGMIIREFSEDNFNPSIYNVSNWDPTKIYYNNKNKKFYIKAKSYTYNKPQEGQTLNNWVEVSNVKPYNDIFVFREDLKQYNYTGAWYYDYLRLESQNDYVDGAVYVTITATPNGYYLSNKDNYLVDLPASNVPTRPTLTQVEIWRPNTFYTKDGNNYVLSNSYDSTKTYYKKVGPYVYSDSNNEFAQGTEWAYENVPDGVILGTRTEKWVAKELTGFTNDNNILGFLVKLNQLLNNDELIRDTSTIPGIQRKVEDILKQLKNTTNVWGDITGTLENQEDLQNALNAKQNILTAGDNITIENNVISASNAPVQSINGIQPDTNSNVQIDATDIETIGGDVAVKVASGNPVTISDVTNSNAIGVNATLEPSQDLYGYDHPWSGGAGKNLLPTPTVQTEVQNVTITNNNGFLTINGTVSTTLDVYMNLETSFTFASSGQKIPLLSSFDGGNIYFINGTTIIGYFSLRANRVLSENDINALKDKTIDKIRFQLVPATYTNATIGIMVVKSSETNLSFEPYSNICPITGRTSVDVTRTGKNLAPMMQNATNRGVTVTVGADGVVTANGTHTGGKTDVVGQSEFITLKAGSYILSGSATANTGVTVQVVKNVDGTISGLARDRTGEGAEFTLEEDSLVAVRGYITAEANVNNLKLYPMIRPASISDSSYEPYTGQSVTVQLGQTVYGGTLNVTTGELTVDRAMVDLGTLKWDLATMGSSVPTGHHAYVHYNLGAKFSGDDEKASNLICSRYVAISRNDTYRGTAEGFAVNASGHLFAYISEYATGTTDAFKTAMSGVQLVYELATPQTIQLTPAQIQLLTGINIISTNADDLSIRYYASGKGNVEGSLTYLSEKKANTSTLATVESTPTASKAYSVGDYLVLNGQLYKVTAEVASGETFVINTNIKTTTTGTELTALNTGLIVQFPSTGWTTTETINDTTYYTQTISVTSVSGNPIVSIVPLSGTLPTSAEQDAFNSVEYFTANDTTNTIKAYATTAPTDTFAAIVKGAK